MANIWLDKRTLNNENSQYSVVKSKQVLSNGNRSVKKQALGEIKNVMHNQIDATPFKGNAAKIDGLPGIFNSKSLCTEVLRKQQMKQNFANAQIKLEKKNKITNAEYYTGPTFDESLFDAWDMDRECCKSQKSDVEIWSEMNMLDVHFADCQIDSEINKDDDHKSFLPDFDELEPMAFDIDPIYDINFEYGILPNLPDLNQFNDDLPF